MPEGPGQIIFTADSSSVSQVIPSPNFGERLTASSPDLIVLHYTGMKSDEAALNWLCEQESQVSCHYFIFEDGKIVQLVAEEKRAWHAGNSCWKGERDINSHSIGIEIVNPGHEFGYVDFPSEQMEAVVRLVRDIVERNDIPATNILAHSDIAPLRKEDPGELFDWHLLYREGYGNWIEPSPVIEGAKLMTGLKNEKVKAFQTALGKLGFEINITGEFDVLTFACTTAFQRHFRQERIDGIADISTVDTLNRLLDEI
ncbi:MAG: N-acetylmuramoyl-L-alanine amidase [Hyphomicrobiales bacterium]|nr:N-acetylmuramoyl-L-alanine amidase [Hyphomicrobiales bacterium]